MQPRGITGRLAGFSSKHPWKIVLFWVALFIVGGLMSAVMPADMTTDATFTNEPESLRGDQLIEDRMDSQPSPDELVIVSSSSQTVDDPEFQAFTNELVGEIAGLEGYVDSAASYYQLGDESLVSDDQQATIIPVFISDLEGDPHPFLDVIEEADGASGFEVVTGGQESVNAVFAETSESDLLTGETIGVSVAMLVLVLVFGTLVAAGIPLILAILSIAIAIGLTMLIGQFFELSIFVTNMIVMIGLAVGIDYALFIIGRYREERRRGLDNRSAIVRTGDSASKAVLFSGLTVVTALLGMLFVPSNIFQSLGTGAIIVVLLSVLATLTLLPAALSLLDQRIDRGRGRVQMLVIGVALTGFAALFQLVMDIGLFFVVSYIVLAAGAFVLAALNIDPFHGRTTNGENGFWDRVTRFVMARAVVLVTVTTAVMIGVALIYFTINLGQSGISTLPEDSLPYRAFTALDENFSGVSIEEPHRIVIDSAAVNTPEIQGSIEELTATMADDPDLGPAQVTVNQAGDLAVITAPATGDTQGTEALEAVERLRSDYVPQAFDGANADVMVTGPSAFTADFNSIVDTYTPVVFAFVLSVSFLLLLLAFRSLVVPVKSVIMNLLSVGTSYGLLVLVFQHGIGNEIFGFRQVERIDAWVPLMMFSILFGLSMDYHVFLISRIRERYDQTRRNTESVAYGLRTTGSMITGAALIMVAVFGGFAMAELSMFQQMGFGLAVAVILDATVVRSVLVPATMRLLGDWNWYLPRWLSWLPKINVEGVPDDEEEEAPEPVPQPVPAD